MDAAELRAKLQVKLFEVVRVYTLSVGGDGDGWIVSSRYAALADAFEKYEKENENWFTERGSGDGIVWFGNNQEAVYFVKDRTLLPDWAGDIIVEVT